MRWLGLAGLFACGRVGFTSAPDAPRQVGDGAGDPATGDTADALVTTGSVCPSTVLISDDFEDGVTAPEWTTLTATDLTLAETAGVLRVTFAPNSSPNEIVGYRQAAKTDYSTVCVIAEITAVPAASASSASMRTRIGISPTECTEFQIGGGMIRSDLHNGAQIHPGDLRAFDPVAHRFLRIRVAAGMTYWEASPDGITFTTLGAVPAVLGTGSSTQLDLIAEVLSAAQNAGKVEWASVVVLVPP